MKSDRDWVILSIPGDERTPTSWYAYNRDTRQQIRCDSYGDAASWVRSLRKV